METVELRWIGPPDQSCQTLARHGYLAACDPDTVYELPRDVARQLARSHRSWQLPASELAAIAAEQGDPSKLGVKELDARYGDLDGYPRKATKKDKAAFVAALSNQGDETK